MKHDPLTLLMKEFSSILKYEIPVGLLPEENNEYNPYEGIDVAIVFYWSYLRELLINNVYFLVKTQDIKGGLSHAALLDIMKSTIGLELLLDYYNKNGREFAVDYISFSGQWRYQYQQDLAKMYPEIRSFSEIPQRNSEYRKIFEILDNRYAIYTNGSKCQGP